MKTEEARRIAQEICLWSTEPFIYIQQTAYSEGAGESRAIYSNTRSSFSYMTLLEELLINAPEFLKRSQPAEKNIKAQLKRLRKVLDKVIKGK